jgi:hypothetical protein
LGSVTLREHQHSVWGSGVLLVWGSGFRVSGFGFRVQGLGVGFRVGVKVLGFGLRVEGMGLGFGVCLHKDWHDCVHRVWGHGLKFRVQGQVSGLRLQGLGFGVEGLWVEIDVLGLGVQESGCRPIRLGIVTEVTM